MLILDSASDVRRELSLHSGGQCYNLVYDTVFWFRCLFSFGCGLIRVVVVVTSLPRVLYRWLRLLWGSDFLRYSGRLPPSGGLEVLSFF